MVTKYREFVRTIFLFLCVFVYLMSNFKSIFISKLSIIDDHDLLPYIFSNQISITSIPEEYLKHNEISGWSNNSRFRPVYWLIKIVEAAVFKEHASLMLVFRLILISISIILISFAVNKINKTEYETLNFTRLLATSLIIASLPAWSDIIPRTGPSEHFLIFGFSITFYAVTNLYDGKLPRGNLRLNNSFLLIGLAIAIGSKENALPLVIVTMPLLLQTIKSAKNKVSDLFSLILLYILCASVLVGPFLAIRRNNGEDIYSNKRGFEQVLFSLQSAIFNIYIAIATIVLIGAIIIVRQSPRILSTELRTITIFAILPFLILLSEQLFYQGEFGGPRNRYSILSQLCLVIIITSTLNYVCIRKKALAMYIVMLLIFAMASSMSSRFPWSNSYYENTSISENWAKKTVNFDKNIRNIINYANRTNSSIFILIRSTENYEESFSAMKYLNSLGFVGDLYLDAKLPDYNDELSKRLAQEIYERSESGDVQLRLRGISRSNLTMSKVCVVFSEESNRDKTCRKTFFLYASRPYSFKWGETLFPRQFLEKSTGWSQAETAGVWSIVDRPSITLKTPEKNTGVVNLEISSKPFLAQSEESKVVKVLVDNKIIGYVEYSKFNPETVTNLQFRRGETANLDKMLITFVIPNPKSPKELGISEDSRKLGIFLSNIRITKSNHRNKER